MAPVQWMQRALPEATLMVQRKNRKGEIDELPDHLMLALIQNPNPHYGDIVLWWGYVLSMALDGNAYWMIVRNGLGRPAALWRSEEHTSELQSLMRISYAVFCLKKKKPTINTEHLTHTTTHDN